MQRTPSSKIGYPNNEIKPGLYPLPLYSAGTRNMTNSPQYSANIAPIISCLHVSITRVCIPVARATHSMLMRLNIETAEAWTHRSERRMEFELAFQRRGEC